MAEYTTAALAKKHVKNFDTSLADTDIDAFIEEAEQILNVTMGASFLVADSNPGGFSAVKHGILRAASNAWAGYNMVVFEPAGFTNITEAFGIRDAFWREWEYLVQILLDKSVVEYMESL